MSFYFIILLYHLTLSFTGLGGADLQGAMTYVRAQPSDIEKWNVKGWTWGRVLKMYKQLENYAVEEGSVLSSVSVVWGFFSIFFS